MNWRVVSNWMTEDEAWNELADLEMAGIHYNLGTRMDYDTVCLKCSGLIARPGKIYYYKEGHAPHPCSCPDELSTLDELEIAREVKAVRAEYADYAKQEIRFCPYCGAALGIRE